MARRHRQRTNSRHARRPAPRRHAIRMAPNRLLHNLHQLHLASHAVRPSPLSPFPLPALPSIPIASQPPLYHHSTTNFLHSYHILSPHIYISLCVFIWGLLASCQSLTTSFSQLLLIRLLLGVGEAAFSPGVPFYLSFFYRRDELALRAAMQIAAAPLASSFAGSLAYLITWLGARSPIQPWRLLFLVEGFPSLVAACVAWGFVADTPDTAWFLTRKERRIAKLRLRREGNGSNEKEEKVGKESAVINKRLDWKEVRQTLADPKAYITSVSFLSFSSITGSITTNINCPAHLPLPQHRLLLPPRLPSHHPNLNGVHSPDFSSSLGAPLPRRYNHPPLVRSPF